MVIVASCTEMTRTLCKHLIVLHRVLAVGQQGSGGRSEHPSGAVITRECADRVWRLPACQRQEPDPASGAPLAEIVPEKQGGSLQLRRHHATEMDRICIGVRRRRAIRE